MELQEMTNHQHTFVPLGEVFQLKRIGNFEGQRLLARFDDDGVAAGREETLEKIADRGGIGVGSAVSGRAQERLASIVRRLSR